MRLEWLFDENPVSFVLTLVKPDKFMFKPFLTNK